MLEEKYEKLHRQQRRIQVSLVIVALLIALGIILLLNNKDKRTTNTIPVPGIAGLQGERGENGKDGNDGYTPLKNIDYFDGQQGVAGLIGPEGYTPQKGLDYFDGQDGVNGKDGYTPVKGTDYNDGAPGAPGRTPIITCNAETQQFEQHYDGDETFTPIEGSDCVAN